MILKDILVYADKTAIPQSWNDACDLIEYERERILSCLAEGRQAYGFTSLLGPLDSYEVLESQQKILLDGHVIGNVNKVEKYLAKIICATKIVNLSNGGTGISKSTYEYLLDAAVNDYLLDRIYIDFSASYGSGDVVPAAQFIRSLLADKHSLECGDLISLINGHYISTAMGIFIFRRLSEIIYSLLECISPFFVTPIQELKNNDWYYRFSPRMIQRDVWDSPPQKSVLFRDAEPILRFIDEAFHRLASEIEKDLSRRSGNPLFVVTSDDILLRSQSSFLNFTFSSSLVQIGDLVKLLSGVLQRATQYCYEKIQDSEDFSQEEKIAVVQYPKVSESYRIKINSIGFSKDYTGYMSGGVEDIWDLGLQCANSVLESIDVFEKQLSIWQEILRLYNKNDHEPPLKFPKFDILDILKFTS
ncbi:MULTISPECIES: hypothetical protein [unclassified Rothia (in: high G+C Gram-positive bacteria)]|uniref:hypothetical protein n=1 Tax=unclassified Rothia (in: high G+C Gram-positive bacteria) TaxID=2689056 RepID=UPI00195DA364|nr:MULTISPECIES: hypothetical protein [unclassified Rothia (in: high G+C Gram-positive bacteria)]MBM7052121.1 hypothetical protein [Rothia sp. ZJ1223]QRZ61446.1 hypothetical protein JR346_09525 [Rothia sp. ZJ932]